MGKVSKLFGVGVKGSINLVLHRVGFVAGDFIDGVVLLRMDKPIETQELVLNVKGSENVDWRERHQRNTSTHYRDRDFLDDTRVIATATNYYPGEYSIAFRYQLHGSLPGSYAVSNRRVTGMHNVNASISYRLKLSLPITTRFSADLEASFPITVIQRRMAILIYPFSIDATKKVRVLGLVSRGECSLTANLDKIVCFAGDMLRINTLIHNNSAVTMSSVKLRLYEDLTVDVPWRSPHSGIKMVCKMKAPGAQAGEQLEQALQLPLVTKYGRPINPTNAEDVYVRWTYFLEVKCSFLMTTSVKAQIPIVVLPRGSS